MEKEKELLDNLKKSLQTEIEGIKSDMRKGLLEKADFETRMNEINVKFDELKAGQIEKSLTDGLQDQIDKLNEKQEALKLTGKQAKSLADEIVKQLPEAVKMFKEKGSGVAEFQIKSGPETMSVINTTGAGVVLEDRMTGINYEPQRPISLLNLVRIGTTSSNSVTWIEKTDEQGKPAFRKELVEAPQRSWKTVKRETLVKEITVFSEYSRIAMEDVEGLTQEVNRDLTEQIQLVLETNILNGEGGTASDADHKGILEVAIPWNNKGFTVAEPNIYDVLAAGFTQIKEEHHTAGAVLISPRLAMQMKLSKDKDGRYIIPPFAATNGVVVDGVRAYESTLMGAKEILIFDPNRAEYKIKRGWQLLVTDSHSDNFTKGVFTVTLTGRGAFVIKNVDYKAFVHVADVDTAITALTPGS